MIPASQYSLALLLVVAAASSDAASLRQPQRGLAAMGSEYHAAMLAAVNTQRSTKGLSALCINKKLQAAAQRHSDDMAAKNFMEHDGSDGSTMSQRITEAGYEWDSVAENVAAGQEDVVSVMQSWIASPGHLENIMGDEYTMAGFAYTYNADSTYGYYWTQDFGSGSTEACDSDSTPQATPAATKQETQTEPTPAPTTSVPVPATKGPVVTPAATTPAPEVPATKGPVATPAATTPGPVATPAATTAIPVATPAATTAIPTPAITTPAPVATPAITTPAPVATTTPPSTSQKDCESNF